MLMAAFMRKTKMLKNTFDNGQFKYLELGNNSTAAFLHSDFKTSLSSPLSQASYHYCKLQSFAKKDNLNNVEGK